MEKCIASPYVFVSSFEIFETSYTVPDISNTIEVDWNSPVFDPEMTIRLQNMGNTYETMCFYTWGRGNGVLAQEDCTEYAYPSWQLQGRWGYDNELKQFKSFAFHNYCLTANQDNSLSLNQCSQGDNNQQWILNSDNYIQLNTDKSKVIGGVNGHTNDRFLKIVDANSPGAIKFEAFKAKVCAFYFCD
jgi:hypothetical protein